uniref:Uncharacterized protein n=1 Tax=Athene cunicularia TaxID=194338 RepID=A0A663MRH0_ATHCN
MKLRIPTRHLLDNPDHYWPPTSHPLHSRLLPSLHSRLTHMPRRPIRLTHPQPPRKRSIHVLHLHLPPHWTGLILRLIPLQRNLKHRCPTSLDPNSHRLRGLRPPMRPDVLLRSHRHHQPILSHPVHRTNPGRMGLRGVLSR